MKVQKVLPDKLTQNRQKPYKKAKIAKLLIYNDKNISRIAT